MARAAQQQSKIATEPTKTGAAKFIKGAVGDFESGLGKLKANKPLDKDIKALVETVESKLGAALISIGEEYDRVLADSPKLELKDLIALLGADQLTSARADRPKIESGNPAFGTHIVKLCGTLMDEGERRQGVFKQLVASKLQALAEAKQQPVTQTESGSSPSTTFPVGPVSAQPTSPPANSLSNTTGPVVAHRGPPEIHAISYPKLCGGEKLDPKTFPREIINAYRSADRNEAKKHLDLLKDQTFDDQGAQNLVDGLNYLVARGRYATEALQCLGENAAVFVVPSRSRQNSCAYFMVHLVKSGIAPATDALLTAAYETYQRLLYHDLAPSGYAREVRHMLNGLHGKRPDDPAYPEIRSVVNGRLQFISDRLSDSERKQMGNEARNLAECISITMTTPGYHKNALVFAPLASALVRIAPDDKIKIQACASAAKALATSSSTPEIQTGAAQADLILTAALGTSV